MGMMSEFRDFALKGNVVDMAVGVVIGSLNGAPGYQEYARKTRGPL